MRVWQQRLMAWSGESAPDTYGEFCLSPVNLRGYHRMVMLYVPAVKLWRTLINPEIVDRGTQVHQTIEDSLLCRPHTPPHTHTRHERVSVQFTDDHGREGTTHLEGDAAVCLQHWLDIFEGHWPCSPNQTAPHTAWHTHPHHHTP